MPEDRLTYLNDGIGLWSWISSTDHKRIAILYLVSITIFFMFGAAAIAIVRIELLTPPGDLITADEYNRAFTMHALIMVWLFLIPSIPAVFGNFVLPMMIGARDVAFPRLNLFSWYLFMFSAVLIFSSLILGGLDTGWTFYAPYSTNFSNSWVVVGALGIFVNGFASIATGVNMIVTSHTMRAPGMSWFRMPLFVWAIYATSLIFVLATPVISMTIILLAAERLTGVGIFNPALGGDPILFEHLFWFYSHPVVYIMILPAMGVITEVISCFSRKKVFGYQFMVYAMVGIAGIGFIVWGHHMFVSGQSAYATLVFSLLSFVIAVPSAIKVFNWTATLFRGSISFEAPMIYALGFIGLFAFGGLTGLFLATIVIDVHLHDTYFVVAHFHTIMVGATMIAYFAALHYWWPKMTGKMYNETAAKVAAALMTVGFLCTFVPQFIMGYAGMARRYYEYAPEFQLWHVISTSGAGILGVAYLLPLIYLGHSWFFGREAGRNPWNASGLEWLAPSPPPKDNFEGDIVVTDIPYVYDPSEHRGPESVKPQGELS